MKYISLFAPEHSHAIGNFVRASLQSLIEAHYTHVLIAPSVEEMGILLRGGTSLRSISRLSPFSDARSSLRKVNVSGHHSDESGQAILQSLLREPYRDEEPVPSLHVHLACYKQPFQHGYSAYSMRR